MSQPRSMSNFIALPDGGLLNLNGAALGEFRIQIQFHAVFDASF